MRSTTSSRCSETPSFLSCHSIDAPGSVTSELSICHRRETLTNPRSSTALPLITKAAAGDNCGNSCSASVTTGTESATNSTDQNSAVSIVNSVFEVTFQRHACTPNKLSSVKTDHSKSRPLGFRSTAATVDSLVSSPAFDDFEASTFRTGSAKRPTNWTRLPASTCNRLPTISLAGRPLYVGGEILKRNDSSLGGCTTSTRCHSI